MVHHWVTVDCALSQTARQTTELLLSLSVSLFLSMHNSESVQLITDGAERSSSRSTATDSTGFCRPLSVIANCFRQRNGFQREIPAFSNHGFASKYSTNAKMRSKTGHSLYADSRGNLLIVVFIANQRKTKCLFVFSDRNRIQPNKI